VLYTALLTDACLDALGDTATVVLDGSFVADPLYAALVSALRPGQDVRVSSEAAGTAAGAALLAGHLFRPAPIDPALDAPPPLDIPGLAAYRACWNERAMETTR
jgi:sugar (pentulose or hexulose) kinase